MSQPADTSVATSIRTVPEGETGTVRASVDTVRKLTWLDSGVGHILLATFFLGMALMLVFHYHNIQGVPMQTVVIGLITLLVDNFRSTMQRFFQKTGDNE